MKKIIAMVLCLLMVTCLIPFTGLATGEPTQVVYYSESFADGVLDTDKSDGKPYWNLDNVTGGTVAVGADPTNSANKCLILTKTTPNDGTKVETSLYLDDAVTNSTRPYSVVKARIMFSATSGNAALFYMFGGATSAGRLMTNGLYSNFMFTTADSANKLINGITANTWYDLRYVIDSTKDVNTYDVFVNDTLVISVEDSKATSKFNMYDLNRILFSLNSGAITVYLDDFNVYTTADKGYTNTEHIYYNDSFDTLKTDKSAGKSYWSLTETGGTISVGTDPKDSSNNCLVFNKTDGTNTTKVEAILDIHDVKPSSDRPYVVVEGRIMTSARVNANLFYMFGNANSGARLMTNGMYAGGFVYSSADSTNCRIIPSYANNTWYKIKYIIDPSKTSNTYDVVVNDIYSMTVVDEQSSKFNTYNINRLLFGMNSQAGTIYLDDLKVYTTANKGFSCDFSDGFSTNTGLWKWTNDKLDGTIDVVKDPCNEYNDALMLSKTSSTGMQTSTVQIPAVYSTEGNSKMVVKVSVMNTAGNANPLYVYGGTNDSALGLSLINYGNRMIANDRVAGGSTVNNTDYLKPYEFGKWYDVTLVFESNGNEDDTFSLYLDGEKKLTDLLARMNIPSITKLYFARSTAGDLYVDNLMAFNPGNDRFVTDIELCDTTFTIPAEDIATYPLTLSVIDDIGGALEDATVKWSMIEPKYGVTLDGSNLIVSSEAADGSVGLALEVILNGVTYNKTFVVDLGKGKFNFSDALFTYDGVVPAEKITPNATMKIKFNATKISDDSPVPTFIAVIYDESLELQKLEIANPPIAKRVTPVEVTIQIPDGISKGTVKLFKWDSVKGMVPYDETVEFSAE